MFTIFVTVSGLISCNVTTAARGTRQQRDSVFGCNKFCSWTSGVRQEFSRRVQLFQLVLQVYIPARLIAIEVFRMQKTWRYRRGMRLGVLFSLVSPHCVVVWQVLMRASSRLHHLLFTSVMRAPVWFFDLTPRGRIVNRFSRDMDESTNTVAVFWNDGKFDAIFSELRNISLRAVDFLVCRWLVPGF